MDGKNKYVKNGNTPENSIQISNDSNNTSPGFFRTIKTMILRYIWQDKKPRVQYAILSRDKMHGGLAAPDIKIYYNAIIIT